MTSLASDRDTDAPPPGDTTASWPRERSSWWQEQPGVSRVRCAFTCLCRSLQGLYARLTLTLGLVITAAVMITTYQMMGDETRAFYVTFKKQAATLAQFAATAVEPALKAGDPAALRARLAMIARIENVERVIVYDTAGQMVADMAGTAVADAPRKAIADMPGPLAAGSVMTESAVIATQPIGDTEIQGWLRMDYGLALVQRYQTRVMREYINDSLILIAVIMGALLLVIRRPVRALKRMTDFAKMLHLRQGEEISVRCDAREIVDLQEALNAASRRIDAQSSAMMETARRLRAVLDNAVDAMITIDDKGIVQTFNRAAECIFGYPRRAVIGNNVAMLMPEPDRSRHDSYIERYAATGEARIIGIGRESVARRSDGSTFPIELSVGQVDMDGGRQYLGVIRDITERKRAEHLLARFGRILDESSNEIYVFDSQTFYFVQVNRGAQNNLGYSMEELEALTIQDITPGATRESVEEAVAPLRDGTKDVLAFETERRRKDGSTYPVEVRLQLSETGDVPVFVAITQDITERKRTEAELQQAHKMETLGQLSGGIAHEFNNLLNAIGGFAHLIKRKADEPELVTEWSDEVISASDQAAALTRQLLAYSRSQALEEKVIAIGPFLDANARLIRSGAGSYLESGMVVHVVMEYRDPGVCVRVDPGQLAQALLNLIINARDAMPDGGAVVVSSEVIEIDEAEAEQHPGAHAGRYANISVRDSGTGIDPSNLKVIFEPFFTTKPEGQGTGLGLSMVYGMVHQSGGFMDVESTLGEGTTFHIYLPVASHDAVSDTPVIHEEDINERLDV